MFLFDEWEDEWDGNDEKYVMKRYLLVGLFVLLMYCMLRMRR